MKDKDKDTDYHNFNFIHFETSKMRNRKNFYLVVCLFFSCLVLVYYLHVIGGISSSGSNNNLGFFKRARYQWKPGKFT